MAVANDVRPRSLARIKTQAQAKKYIDAQVKEIREQVGDGKVLLALSGGVDSSVCAALISKAIGKQLTCVHVNHGLLRKGEPEMVCKVFNKQFKVNLIYVDATDRFLDALKGVKDPERKRKIIGKMFIDIFAEEANKLEGIGFLCQGTIYPDILESKDGIKAHHNVGGLPKNMRKFQLVEPVKFLYKDEVRVVGKALGLPENMVMRQPFPGPGLGVRCVGAITRDRLEAVRESDAILREEFKKAGLEGKVWQYFTVVPDFKSTGIKKGKRVFEWPVVIRAINSVDATSATPVKLDWQLVQTITDKITKKVPGVNRVLWDVTPKEPATIEWE
ncbi:MAG: glutamine-hydrolyzing GMP synthase [Firmicutes bacterium]|nr:glutamine-hydrolyzing GMP synthase [Bacillota bacterium]